MSKIRILKKGPKGGSPLIFFVKNTCVFWVLVPGTNFEFLLFLAFSTGVLISGKKSKKNSKKSFFGS